MEKRFWFSILGKKGKTVINEETRYAYAELSKIETATAKLRKVQGT
jgi:hypothetical protein